MRVYPQDLTSVAKHTFGVSRVGLICDGEVGGFSALIPSQSSERTPKNKADVHPVWRRTKPQRNMQVKHMFCFIWGTFVVEMFTVHTCSSFFRRLRDLQILCWREMAVGHRAGTCQDLSLLTSDQTFISARSWGGLAHCAKYSPKMFVWRDFTGFYCESEIEARIQHHAEMDSDSSAAKLRLKICDFIIKKL